MKTLGNLIVIFLVILGGLALIPLAAMGMGIVMGVLCIAIWLVPFWIIATSDKTTGFEKIAWLLAMICLSWFAWVFYFFLAPIKPRRRYSRYHDDDYFYDYR
ncbi:MAG: hypothetical protein RL839_11780 [Gammaproteobacteria bacterium]